MGYRCRCQCLMAPTDSSLMYICRDGIAIIGHLCLLLVNPMVVICVLVVL